MESKKKENFHQFNFENFNQTSEEDVGIIEFVNKVDEGFECVLKHRYSDFIVNEISEDCNVIWLKNNNSQANIKTSTSEYPNKNNEGENKNEESQLLEQQIIHETNETQEKAKKKLVLSPESVNDIIKIHFIGEKILDEEDGEKLNELINKFNDKDDYKYKLNDLRIEIKFNEDKVKRKKLHENIRKYFNFLESEASTQRNQNPQGNVKNFKKKSNGNQNKKEDSQNLDLNENNTQSLQEDKKYIAIYAKYVSTGNQKKENSYENNSVNQRRKLLPDESKKYLCFSMQKKNMEILQAINFISRVLKRSNKSLGYAGNKDKRGITTQLISIYNTLPEELIALTKKPFWDKRIFIDNFFYVEDTLKLGQLKGNQFCVALRFIKGNKGSVIKRIESVKENGFLNYYGMQRFGCSCIPTHKVGLLIIKNKWDQAILDILNTTAVREILNVKDFKELKFENIYDNIDLLLKNISKGRANVEFKILKCLKNNKKGFFNAFKSLNRQLQVLYPHAYQSYIWNRTVSERIKKFKLQVLIGDIVLKKGFQEEIIPEENAEINEDEDNIVTETDDCKDVEGDLEGINKIKQCHGEIDKIEEKTAQMNNFKNKELYDKAFDEKYEYVTEKNINQYLISDVVIPIIGTQVKYPRNETYELIKNILKEDEIEIEDLIFKESIFNSKGHYRKFIQVPKSIEYEFVNHDDPDEDLLNENYNIEPHPIKSGNKYTSLRLVFQLPQSTYATMLFRELTKISSDSKVQAGLSQKNIEN